MKSNWSILAVYENTDARQLAVQFCDGLVQRFWSESGFDLSWCDWRGLEHPVSAKEAGTKAREADLMIVVLSSHGRLTSQVQGWLESALRNRCEREGVLVGLPNPQPGFGAEAAATQMYLRKLAHEAGMDYLTALPESLPTRAPVSPEVYKERATQVTNVLNDILSHTSQPPRLL